MSLIGAPPGAQAGIPNLKTVRPRERTVTTLEYEMVFHVAGPMLQLCLLLAREAGLRHKTILDFTAAQCNFQAGTISGRSKAYASYTIPMTERLRERLLWACAGATDSHEPLLCQYNRQRKKPHYNSLTTALMRAKRLCGLSKPGQKVGWAGWGFHDLRRTAARELYDRTKDLRKVQRFLGHAQPGQALWYLGNAAVELEAADLQTTTPKSGTEVA